MSNCQNPTIAIIDSGIGGVSVLRQLISKCNGGNYIYFADNLFMPYGNKTKSWLKNRLNNIIEFLNDKYKVDFIIVACNTASANINQSDYDNVKIMSFDNDLTYFATNLTKKTLRDRNIIASNTLAKQIEFNINNQTKLEHIVKRHINFHKLNKLNQFVLGCTHYELAEHIFKKFCPNSEIINNSSFLINKLDFLTPQKEFNLIMLTSKQDYKLQTTILNLLRSH